MVAEILDELNGNTRMFGTIAASLTGDCRRLFSDNFEP